MGRPDGLTEGKKSATGQLTISAQLMPRVEPLMVHNGHQETTQVYTLAEKQVANSCKRFSFRV